MKDVETADADKDQAKIALAGLLTRRDELDKELRLLDAKGEARGTKAGRR